MVSPERSRRASPELCRRVLDNFDLLAEAPGGVPKLRELILQLAVRGKLVPQEEGSRKGKIHHEGHEGRKEGEKIEGPYALPQGWRWIRLPDVGRIVGGGTPRSTNSLFYAENGIPWLTPADLYGYREKYIARGRRDLSEDGLRNSSAQLMPKGAVLFSSRAPIGYIAIAANPLATNQGFKSVVPHDPEMSEFIYWYLKSAGDEIDRNASGTTFREISGKGMAKVLFPLPPLAEQKRIVARVDELMKRCDELEARQNERNARHTVLVSSCLHQLVALRSPGRRRGGEEGALTAKPEPRILPARRSLGCPDTRHLTPDTFNLLFTTPSSVAELRKTILQLAVLGRLVPKNSNEKPVSDQDLLAGHTKRGSRRKLALTIAHDREPFAVAERWRWTTLGNLAARIEYGTSQKATRNSSGVPVLRMGNIRDGRLDFTDLKYVPTECEDLPKLLLSDGDILFNRTNSAELVGKAAVFHGEAQAMTFASYLVRVSLHPSIAHPDFYGIAINSAYYRRTQIEPTLVQQCGQANFSGSKLAASVVPLPPLAEQKRIVAKVNELMAICDELESKLTQSRSDANTLAAAVVHHVCNSLYAQ